MFLWFSDGFPLVSLWISHGFTILAMAPAVATQAPAADGLLDILGGGPSGPAEAAAMVAFEKRRDGDGGDVLYE